MHHAPNSPSHLSTNVNNVLADSWLRSRIWLVHSRKIIDIRKNIYVSQLVMDTITDETAWARMPPYGRQYDNSKYHRLRRRIQLVYNLDMIRATNVYNLRHVIRTIMVYNLQNVIRTIRVYNLQQVITTTNLYNLQHLLRKMEYLWYCPEHFNVNS